MEAPVLSTGTNSLRHTHSAAFGGNTAPNGRSLPGLVSCSAAVLSLAAGRAEREAARMRTQATELIASIRRYRDWILDADSEPF